MHEKDPYSAILGVQAPWHLESVALYKETEEVRVTIAMDRRHETSCPQCGKACGRYDTRRRSWRHLDTCQFKTILDADVPRVSARATAWSRSMCRGPSLGRASRL